MSISVRSLSLDKNPVVSLSPVFPLICSNRERIMNDPKMFWSVLPGSRTGFCYGGGFDVALGLWMMAWEKGLGVRACEYCEGQVRFIFSNGAMSRGWSRGYCSLCGKEWSGREWAVGTWGYLRERKTELSMKMESDFKPYEFEQLLEMLGASSIP